MGSIKHTYSMCEKCHGLFTDLEVVSNHVALCQGNVKASSCDLVACEKHLYLQYVKPRMINSKKAGGRPRKKIKLESSDEKDGGPKASISHTKNAAVETEEPTRRYGLRKGAAAALHDKITDMQKTLGLYRKEKKEDRKFYLADSDKNDASQEKKDRPTKVSSEASPGNAVLATNESKDQDASSPDTNQTTIISDKEADGQERISTAEMAASILQKLKSSSSALIDGKLIKLKAGSKISGEVPVNKTPVSTSECKEGEGVKDIEQNDSNSNAKETANTTSEGTPKENVEASGDGDHDENKFPQPKITIEDKRNEVIIFVTDANSDDNSAELEEAGSNHSSENGNETGDEKTINERIDTRSALKPKPDTEEKLKKILPLPPPDANGIYHCTLCWYRSSKEGMFRRHLGSHNDGNMYTCEFCNAQFLYRRLYRQHMGTHKGFQCEHCGKMFGRRHDRQRHIHSFHTGEAKYECEICGYTCRHHHLLNDHKRKHTDARYTCQIGDCTFKTIYRRALLHHTNTVHNAEKNLVCDNCGYRTNDHCSFNKHMKTHGAIRQYQCSECDYTANTMGYVRAHMLSHSTEKLYKCDQCEYTCVRRSGIRSHMLKHIGVKPWSCPKCEYTSTTKVKVKRHIDMKHKDDSVPLRQKVRIRFDTDAYRIGGPKQSDIENEGNGDESLASSQDSTRPKYVVIDMLDGDGETGTALSSNLVGEEVIVQEISASESTAEREYFDEAAAVVVNQDNINAQISSNDQDIVQEEEQGQEHEQDQDPNAGYLYKCALCNRCDSSLTVIQEHMSADHSETETVTTVTEAGDHPAAVTYPGQGEITIAQLLEAAATSSPGVQEGDQRQQEHQQPQAVVESMDTSHDIHSSVACIYQAANGTVINPIQVEHISDQQIVALQDDAVSTAVESILHLQNIPIKGDVV